MARLHRAAHGDPVPAMAFHKVANLLAPPPSVMHPRVMFRVFLGNVFPKRPMGVPEPSAAAAR